MQVIYAQALVITAGLIAEGVTTIFNVKLYL